MHKNRLDFLGHIMGIEDKRLLKQLVEYNLAKNNTTSGCKGIKEIGEALKVFGLTPEYTVKRQKIIITQKNMTSNTYKKENANRNIFRTRRGKRIKTQEKVQGGPSSSRSSYQ